MSGIIAQNTLDSSGLIKSPEGGGGAWNFIKKLTASASSDLSFVDGTSDVVLDSTYKTYVFTFNNMHPETDNVRFEMNMSADGGSNYNVTKTTTLFDVAHAEADNDARISYDPSGDLAQSTGYQLFGNNLGIGNGSDESLSGELFLFNPSSTTYVKHFMSRVNLYGYVNYSFEVDIAGYANTTSAINAINFQMSSGNIDAGDICLYGIST